MYQESNLYEVLGRMDGSDADRNQILSLFAEKRSTGQPIYDNESLIRDLIKLNITAVEALGSALTAIHMPPRIYSEELQDD